MDYHTAIHIDRVNYSIQIRVNERFISVKSLNNLTENEIRVLLEEKGIKTHESDSFDFENIYNCN